MTGALGRSFQGDTCGAPCPEGTVRLKRVGQPMATDPAGDRRAARPCGRVTRGARVPGGFSAWPRPPQTLTSARRSRTSRFLRSVVRERSTGAPWHRGRLRVLTPNFPEIFTAFQRITDCGEDGVREVVYENVRAS